MSVKVITAVFDLAPAVVTAPERLVLLELAWHADEHGRNAWPAVSTVCRRTSLSRRGVQIILRKLKEKGLVYVQSVALRGSVRYGVDLDALDCARYAQSAPHDCAHGAQSATDDRAASARGGAPDAQSLRTTCAEGAHHVRGGGAPGAPDPSVIRPLTVREPSKKKYLAAERRVSAPNDNNDEDHDSEDDQTALTRIAHQTFDALPENATFDALREDFVGRLNGRKADHILEDLGSFLFSVRMERLRRRASDHTEATRWPRVGRL